MSKSSLATAARFLTGDPGPAFPVHSALAAPRLLAGSVQVRHHQSGAFRFSYGGEQPVLLFLFSALRVRGAAGEAACRSGSFALLMPGAPKEVHVPEPLEVLTVAYDGCGAAPGAVGARKADQAPHRDLVDPGVRSLAHELRRVILREPRPSPEYVESLARSMLVRALQVIGSSAAPRRPAAMTPLKLRRVADHIGAHLDQPISVADLAALSGLSRAHFTRAFQSATGQTPHRFILSRRLEQVRRLLDLGAKDLSLVAARTGFSSHAHMTTAFKQASGVTPGDYRRTHDLSQRFAAE